MSESMIHDDDVVCRVFIESSALEQVVAIHSGIPTDWVKQATASTLSPGALRLDPHWPVSHGFSRLLTFWVIVVYLSMRVEIMFFALLRVKGTQLRRLDFLLGFLVGSLIARDPQHDLELTVRPQSIHV
ncbi:hypothetical protein TNCV_3058021 [Trichonephila clavipes]|nr:hypothetical protein TNCV_3058021 [Trichonephila clavipes]